MRKFFLHSVLLIILFNSCSKEDNSKPSYDYDVNTTNPATLPLGSLVADVDGIKTNFDSVARVQVSYSQIENHIAYTIAITGFNYQSAQKYNSLNVQLKGWKPMDTASFYNYQTGTGSPGTNTYELGYYMWTNNNFNAYNFNNQTKLYKARITHIDDSTIQGTFSGYLPPYNCTNGAFNLRK